MKTTNDLVYELMERDDQASDLEDCIAEIKKTFESPYLTDEAKVKYARQSIEDYGF